MSQISILIKKFDEGMVQDGESIIELCNLRLIE